MPLDPLPLRVPSISSDLIASDGQRFLMLGTRANGTSTAAFLDRDGNASDIPITFGGTPFMLAGSAAPIPYAALLKNGELRTRPLSMQLSQPSAISARIEIDRAHLAMQVATRADFEERLDRCIAGDRVAAFIRLAVRGDIRPAAIVHMEESFAAGRSPLTGVAQLAVSTADGQLPTVNYAITFLRPPGTPE